MALKVPVCRALWDVKTDFRFTLQPTPFEFNVVNNNQLVTNRLTTSNNADTAADSYVWPGVTGGTGPSGTYAVNTTTTEFDAGLPIDFGGPGDPSGQTVTNDPESDYFQAEHALTLNQITGHGDKYRHHRDFVLHFPHFRKCRRSNDNVSAGHGPVPNVVDPFPTTANTGYLDDLNPFDDKDNWCVLFMAVPTNAEQDISGGVSISPNLHWRVSVDASCTFIDTT